MMENVMNKCEGREHIIKEGDTLYKISRMHNVPLDELLKANALVNVYNLKVGDKICVPMISNDDDNLRPNKPENNMSEDIDYKRMFVYVVKDGDTLDNILSKYNIEMDDLMKANKQNRVMLKPGSIVIVPAVND